MEIALLEKLPARAGKAEIMWGSDETIAMARWGIPIARLRSNRTIAPARNGNTISFSTDKLIDIHPLKGGEHYLAKFGNPIRAVLFGTDENVFMTGVTDRAYRAFLKGGESAFYESLKPAVIKVLEALGYGPTDRQGDVWICRLADTWNEALSNEMFSRPARPIKDPSVVDGRSLMGTRHRLTGMTTIANVVTGVIGNLHHKDKHKRKLTTTSEGYVLLSGVIEAPDHEPMSAKDGIYLMARSANMSEKRIPFPGAE